MSVSVSAKSLLSTLMVLFSFQIIAQEISTTELPKSYEDGERSSFGVSYFLLSSMPVLQMQKEGSQSLSAYNFIGLNYKLSKDTKISVRPVFYWNTSGQNKYGDTVAADTSIGDAHIVYSDYSMYNNEDLDLKLSGSYKLYLPTSEISQKAKNYFQVRGEYYLEKRYSVKGTVTYVAKPEVHFQSQKAFIDDTNPQFVSAKTTKAGALEHYVEVKQDLNRTFSLKPTLGFKEEWSYGSEENQLNEDHTTVFKSALGLEVRPLRKLNFTLYLENLTRLSSQKNGDQIAFFHPNNNSIVLLLNSSL